MKSFLYYVQEETGREVCSVRTSVERVSQVKAETRTSKNGKAVRLLKDGVSIASGTAHLGSSLKFYRVPADDKLAKPVIHPVKEIKS